MIVQNVYSDIMRDRFYRQLDAGVTTSTGLLYPHLPNNGDQPILESFECFSCYKEVQLQEPVHFYENTYNRIFVHSHGVLAFEDGGKGACCPGLSGSNRKVIAPLWGDVLYQRNPGSGVWFRETNKASLLNRAKNDIDEAFAADNFQPTSLFIATWQRVISYCDVFDEGYFPGWVDDEDLEYIKKRLALRSDYNSWSPQMASNSFQVVLASDSSKTYAMFNIHTIEWDYCWEYVVSGFVNSPTQAYQNPLSGSNTSYLLTQQTNTNKGGRWIYRIDTKVLTEPE